MRYALRRPCKHCPFRSDIPRYLHPERYRELAHAAIEAGSFCCHETVAFDDEGENVAPEDRQQMCAGAMILAEHEQRPGQMMRIAERLRLYDPNRLDMDAPVYRSVASFLGED